jgi:hypothetical protein
MVALILYMAWGTAMPNEHQSPGAITQKDVDDYRALCINEVHLLSLRLGDIYIVLERAKPRLFEILPEEIKFLANACRLFDAAVIKIQAPYGA